MGTNCYYEYELPHCYLNSNDNIFYMCSDNCYECINDADTCMSCNRGYSYNSNENKCIHCIE